jgi:hypothetical protein
MIYFPKDVSIEDLGDNLSRLIEDPDNSLDMKRQVLFNVVLAMPNMTHIRAVDDTTKRGWAIGEVAKLCLQRLGEEHEFVYHMLSMLTNIRHLVNVECAQVRAVFADYTREPADFDIEGRVVSKLYKHLHPCTARGQTHRMPDIVVPILRHCLDVLARLYPANIKRRR